MAEDDNESVCVPLSEDHPPSFAVIEGVAALTNTEPTECPILQQHVDTDALDKLIADSEISTVSFLYHGCQITVRGDRAITVKLI